MIKVIKVCGEGIDSKEFEQRLTEVLFGGDTDGDDVVTCEGSTGETLNNCSTNYAKQCSTCANKKVCKFSSLAKDIEFHTNRLNKELDDTFVMHCTCKLYAKESKPTTKN